MACTGQRNSTRKHRSANLKVLICTLALTLLAVPAQAFFFTLKDSTNQISFKNMLSLPLQFIPINGNYYDRTNIVMGAQQTNRNVGTDVPVAPDLSENSVIVGSASNLNWGVFCDDKSSCTVSQGTHKCVRGTSTADCSFISTFLRFENASLPSGVSKLDNIEMLLTQDNWNPKGQGVLGFSPNSIVWPYLANQYDNGKDYFDVSLFYRGNSLIDIIRFDGDNYKNAVLVVNGKGIAIDPFFISYPLDAPGAVPDAWVIPSVNVTQTVNGKEVTSAERVCVANVVNYTIAVKDVDNVKSNMFSQLCGMTSGCTKSNSNLNNLKKWSLTLYNSTDQDSQFVITLKPEELVTFLPNGTAYLLVGNLNSYGSICSSSTMILGKYFLVAREMVIRYNKSNKTFLIGFHSFEPSLVFLIILLVLAGIIFTVFVIVCIYSIIDKTKKRFNKPGEYSAAPESSKSKPVLSKGEDLN